MDQTKLILYGFIFIAEMIIVNTKKINKQKITWVDDMFVYGAFIAMVVNSF